MHSTILGCLLMMGSNTTTIAQTTSTTSRSSSACPPPALSRLTRHTVAPGETLTGLAQRYNLIPATLMGFNPSLRSGKATVGSEIVIPPYNGIRVELSPGQTLKQIAQKYGVRPDVLFEVNGCQSSPRVAFVPGINWSPIGAAPQTASVSSDRALTGSPLPAATSRNISLGYGWGIVPVTGKVGFHSGIDLLAPVGTPVLTVADGTVAFAATQGTYGKLVVINHQEGLQTRYAQLNNIKVKVGQRVTRGQEIATVGMTGRPSSKESHLHFEVRARSQVGWVAENPESYLPKDNLGSAQSQR